MPAGRSNSIYSIDVNDRIREVRVTRDMNAVANFAMGLYIMKRTLLLELVEDCMSHSAYDFDRDLIQKNVSLLRILGYEYRDTAFILSSVEEYFKANMALTNVEVMRELIFKPNYPIYTKVRDDMPAKIRPGLFREQLCGGRRLRDRRRNRKLRGFQKREKSVRAAWFATV